MRTRVVAVLGMVLAGGLLLGLESSTQGQGRKKGWEARRFRDAQLIQELRRAKALLLKANHDYDGHRVKAIHQVNLALRQLNKDSGARPKETIPLVRGDGREPQPLSDAQLKQARQILTAVQGQLTGLYSTPHRRKAGARVTDAIKQIDLAFAWRAKLGG
jgi:hypothetical protein